MVLTIDKNPQIRTDFIKISPIPKISYKDRLENDLYEFYFDVYDTADKLFTNSTKISVLIKILPSLNEKNQIISGSAFIIPSPDDEFLEEYMEDNLIPCSVKFSDEEVTGFLKRILEEKICDL